MCADKEINTQGLSCPVPLVHLARAIRTMQAGEVIQVTGDDPIFETGIRDFCEGNGYELLTTEYGEGRVVSISLRV